MAARKIKQALLGTFVVILAIISTSRCQFLIPQQNPSDCAKSSTDRVHQFFDISSLQCKDCAQNSTYQTVSDDGLRCVCRVGMKLTKDYGGAEITCESCGKNQTTSYDGWSCVECSVGTKYNPLTWTCDPCDDGFVGVERALDGVFPSGQMIHSCKECAPNTSPNIEGTQCLRCNQILSVNGGQDCVCNYLTGGVCFASAGDILSQISTQVKFDAQTTVESAYFVDNLKAAQGMCQESYKNLTSCQLLGNLCVMTLYSAAVAPNSDACSAYKVYVQIGQDWAGGGPENMPWLYYLENTADQVLDSSRISTVYTFPNERLNLRVAQYTLNGNYLGMFPATGGLLQLCKGSESIMNAAYSFGTVYKQSCKIPAEELFNAEKYPLIFNDVFLEMEGDGGVPSLVALPVLILNYEDASGNKINQDQDRTKWQLVRRFFLVDNISGRPASAAETSNPVPKAVRYARSIKLIVKLKESQNGEIYPPYFEIDYGVLKDTDLEAQTQAEVSFEVIYKMDMTEYNEDVKISVGVLCALSSLFSFLQAWSWSKRAGKLAIDFPTILKFVLFSLGNIANAFFIVMFGASIWWLIFYKRQNTVYLILPTKNQEEDFVAYVSVAFALKILHLVHMIVTQVSIDIFFIDWERPRGKAATNNSKEKSGENPISVWRTCFIANEWNEIQTTRKINDILQLFLMVFFLVVLGFQNLATKDPIDSLSIDSDTYRAEYSRVCRFAVATLTYMILAAIQWVFVTFIYERFVEDPVRQYVDLCSVSNVSVFILENNNYGYYIHGRSVHGMADTDMKGMSENLKREEDNLCGERGLQPNDDQQTFEIQIPMKLRTHYDKIMIPITQQQHGAAAAGGRQGKTSLDPQMEACIDAAKSMNHLIQGFIDHSMPGTDYLIKDKMLFESILNAEFQDGGDKGHFYNDDGHSFDKVLFYGNELTIGMFEILLFNAIDLIAEDFVLAAVLTYIMMKIINMVRNSLGEANLARKTMIDRRFLI